MQKALRLFYQFVLSEGRGTDPIFTMVHIHSSACIRLGFISVKSFVLNTPSFDWGESSVNFPLH